MEADCPGPLVANWQSARAHISVQARETAKGTAHKKRSLTFNAENVSLKKHKIKGEKIPAIVPPSCKSTNLKPTLLPSPHVLH